MTNYNQLLQHLAEETNVRWLTFSLWDDFSIRYYYNNMKKETIPVDLYKGDKQLNKQKLANEILKEIFKGLHK